MDDLPLTRTTNLYSQTSSKTTKRSTYILRLQFSFSKTSLQRSFLNSRLLKGDTEEREGVLLALVLLGMVLGKRQTQKQNQQKQKEKPRVDYKLAQKKIKQKYI